MAEPISEQQPIPWMTPEKREQFLAEIRASLGRGREIKPMSYQEYVEARLQESKDAAAAAMSLRL